MLSNGEYPDITTNSAIRHKMEFFLSTAIAGVNGMHTGYLINVDGFEGRWCKKK